VKVTGGCHCGAVKFTAEVDPAKVRICHCTDCQIIGGSAYTTNAPAMLGTFKLLSGSPAIYIKTAESGNKRAHAFCTTCATRIYSGSVGIEPPQYSLRAGALDQRDQLPPKQQIWCDSAMPWAKLAGVEERAKQ
jgi:hypothetical protein